MCHEFRIGLYALILALASYSAPSRSATSSAVAPKEEHCQKMKGQTLDIGFSDKPNQENSIEVLAALDSVAKEMGIKVNPVFLKTAEALDGVHGFFTPGGHDPDPKYYTSNVSDDKERDEIWSLHKNLANGGKQQTLEQRDRDELTNALIKKYLAGSQYSNMPYLGICYGMQMLAAANGIPLIVDIPAQLAPLEARRDVDQIRLNPKSKLAKYFDAKVDTYTCAENHHQAVSGKYWQGHKSQHPTVQITGWSNDDRIPEVIELTDRPALGVQCHPESQRTTDPAAATAPFKWFLENACARKIQGVPKIKADKSGQKQHKVE